MLNRYTTTIIAFIALLVLNGCENYAERTHESWIEAPSGVAYDDSTIHARIAYAVDSDSELQGANIEIKADQGKVLLTGTAANHNQITRLNMLSWMVDGVKDVDIQISPQ